MQFLSIAFVLLATVAARAGDLPGAGSHTNPVAGDSHGWAAIASRTGSVSIQHFPPRGVDAAGRKGADDGTVRLAASLAQMPEALGATGNRLYLVFPPASSGAGTRRQVLMLEAQRGSMDQTWVGDPGGERLPSLPALPGDRKLLGFTGSPAGPVAMLAGDASQAEQLLILSGSAWVPLAMPAQGRVSDPFRLVSTAGGIAVVSLGKEHSGAWIAELPATRESDDRPNWIWAPLGFLDAATDEPMHSLGSIFHIRGRFFFERRTGDNVEVWEAMAEKSRRLAAIQAVPRGYASVPLDQTGRLALAWRTVPDAKAGSAASERIRIAEVSIQTGQVLFEGEAQTQPPFSRFELKILAAFLVAVMLAIVVFVLRPDRTGEPLSLPKGVFLADPGRRLFAAILDVGLAFMVATQLTGIGGGDVASVRALTGQIDAVTLYLATIGAGLAMCTFTEWVFGRSIGKAFTGIEVARPVMRKLPEGQIEPGLARMTFGAALLRNIVKWVLPPVAMSGLSTPERRHRGDTAGGTVVIVREETEAP